MNWYTYSLAKLHELLKHKEISSEEITRSVLTRIEAVEPRIHSFITLTADLALKQARDADAAIARGEIHPLTGIPLSIKDVLCTRGVRTTCGSKILYPFIPPYDATVIEKLKAQNLVMVGKTNMDEFAMGSSTENSAFGPTRNPWNTTLIPGGSSGGSAASVAAGECIASLGSDTGGSIRQPAAHCGVVGLKPTYGRVSRYGLVAFASSLDQIGPFTREVKDCALLLGAISGHDPRDSTSAPQPVPDYTKALVPDLHGITLGIAPECLSQGLDPSVQQAMTQALEVLKGLGADLVEIALPHTKYVVAVYYIIAPAEASSNLARYDGVKYGFRAKEGKELLEMYAKTRSLGFGPEVIRRIMLGTYVLSAGYYEAYYRKASQVRTLITRDFLAAFQKCDAIISPVAPTPAFALGEKVHDPLQMYLSDIFTISANLAGIPGLSVPCGLSPDGRPVGLHIQGPHFREDTLLRVGYAFEQATHPQQAAGNALALHFQEKILTVPEN